MDSQKRIFVGALITNKRQEVLLVNRASDDPDMGGLWSLPAGEVEKSESLESALIRECKEEINGNIKISRQISTIEREKWKVHVFDCSFQEGESFGQLSDEIACCQYFKTEDIPETIVFEALIPILKYWDAREKIQTADAFHFWFELILSSIFFSYIEPETEEINDFPSFEILNHIVKTTPSRKFKSSLLYLLSDFNEEAKKYSLLSEYFFATWTLLDDLCDEKTSRYGVETSRNKFGVALCSSEIFSLQKRIADWLDEKISSTYSSQLQSALLKCAEAQTFRFQNENLEDFDAYLEQAVNRTRFLGDSWCLALSSMGLGNKAKLVEDIYENTAKAGQLLNDYLDLVREPMRSDFSRKVVSSYVFLLKAKVSVEPLYEEQFNSLWLNNSLSREEDESLCHLLDVFDIAEDLQHLVYSQLVSALDKIENDDVDSTTRLILRSWIYSWFYCLDKVPEVEEIDYKCATKEFLGYLENGTTLAK